VQGGIAGGDVSVDDEGEEGAEGEREGEFVGLGRGCGVWEGEDHVEDAGGGEEHGEVVDWGVGWGC